MKVDEVRTNELLDSQDIGVYERSVHCIQCSDQIGPHALYREEMAFSERHRDHPKLFRTYYSSHPYHD